MRVSQSRIKSKGGIEFRDRLSIHLSVEICTSQEQMSCCVALNRRDEIIFVIHQLGARILKQVFLKNTYEFFQLLI